MDGSRVTVLLLCLFLFPVVLTAGPQQLVSTSYTGYNPFSGQFDVNQVIVYKYPDPARFGYGPYPLFVWVPGTFETYTDIQAMTFLEGMVSRGFVSASVQYNNVYPLENCSNYRIRTQAIFESSRPTSAISVLCRVGGVNCGKGVAVAGMSQGAAISILSKNFAPAVQAVYALSISDYNKMGIDLSSCLDKSTTDLPANRLTIVNGQNDPFFSGQDPLQKVSGVVCPPGSTQCWNPDGRGSGWYIIQDFEVSDQNADHCYQLVGDCSLTYYDPNWFSARFNWSLKPNLDWLASLGTRRFYYRGE